MGILPGLVRLDLSIGGCLVGDGEEVTCGIMIPPNIWDMALHYTAAVSISISSFLVWQKNNRDNSLFQIALHNL